jgi:SAM-dependent methyltransferase
MMLAPLVFFERLPAASFPILHPVKVVSLRDLRTYAPEPGSFDYIIAHGVLSWIPDDAKDALFALCAGALAPQGVAYISYNLYPGWKQREVLRDLVDLMGGVAPTPTDRLTAAERTLATLDRLIAGRTEPHAELHRALIAESRRKHPAGLYHDELGSINDPCYFLQFAAWAAKHGLDYLGEAEWYAMFPELVGASARSVLAEFAHDRLRLEQLLDFIRNRSFRCSLLTPAPFVARHPDPAVLRTCRIGSSLRPQVGVPILQAGVRVRFGGQSPLAFASDEPVTKAVFSILADAWPRRLPFAEVLTATARLLTAVGLDRPADLENQLLARLLDACGWCRADFMTDIPIECALRPDATPKVHPLVRLMAGQDLPVVNAWHEPIPLDAAARSLLASLDGTRTEFSAAEQSQLQHFAASALLMP